MSKNKPDIRGNQDPRVVRKKTWARRDPYKFDDIKDGNTGTCWDRFRLNYKKPKSVYLGLRDSFKYLEELDITQED